MYLLQRFEQGLDLVVVVQSKSGLVQATECVRERRLVPVIGRCRSEWCRRGGDDVVELRIAWISVPTDHQVPGELVAEPPGPNESGCVRGGHERQEHSVRP